MSTNRETVMAIYEAFGRGDVPTILNFLADDVDWEYATVASPIPWLRPGRGHAHVMGFFGALSEHLDDLQFEATRILDGDDVIVALTNFTCTVRATGRGLAEHDEPHIWYFDADGKVTRVRHAADTLQHFEALQGATAVASV